jgi:hypothetical protein
MRRRTVFSLIALILGGCASTQLNYNTLDLGSTVDHLLTAQVIRNLGSFIDSPAALPAQILINGGTATTSNSVGAPNFFTPLSSAVTVATNIAANGSVSSSKTTADPAKTLQLNASNVASQNWAFDPVHEGDQLRRLYALYRFAVWGNADPAAQKYLACNYPLQYTPLNDKKYLLDDSAIYGPNCVLCACESENGGGRAFYRQVLPGSLGDYQAGPKSPTGTSCSNVQRNPSLHRCFRVNKRLLPTEDWTESWLRWDVGRDEQAPYSRPPRDGDIPIGKHGLRRLYVDGGQPDRFAEFTIFIAVAASSADTTSSGGGTGRKPKSQAAPTTFIIPQ